MISWIIFFLGVIVSITSGYLFNTAVFNFGQILLIFLVALVILILLNAICALVCAKWLPNKMYNGKFFTPSALECKFYVCLGVRSWKDTTAEWGALNGFSKQKVANPKDPEYIKKFILECKKGYLTHFSSLFVSLLFFFCVPKTLLLSMALPMYLTAFVLNFIPIAILRYNTQRLTKLLHFVTRNKASQ